MLLTKFIVRPKTNLVVFLSGPKKITNLVIDNYTDPDPNEVIATHYTDLMNNLMSKTKFDAIMYQTDESESELKLLATKIREVNTPCMITEFKVSMNDY